MDWQPIETAPKGRDYIDVIVFDGQVVRVAFWDDEEEVWLDSMNHDGYEHGRLKPTHWMPLPEPPNG